MGKNGVKKHQTHCEALADAAAQDLNNKQLELLDLPTDEGQASIKRKPGRPKGAKGKGKDLLHAHLDQQGYHRPADRLAALAGLNSPLGPFDLAFERSAAICSKLGIHNPDKVLNVLHMVLKHQSQAAAALLPYTQAKITPDLVIDNANAVQINHITQLSDGSLVQKKPEWAMHLESYEKQRLSTNKNNNSSVKSQATIKTVKNQGDRKNVH